MIAQVGEQPGILVLKLAETASPRLLESAHEHFKLLSSPGQSHKSSRRSDHHLIGYSAHFWESHL